MNQIQHRARDAFILGVKEKRRQTEKTKKAAKEKARFTKKKRRLNDRREGSEPDLSLYRPSCHFQLEEFEHGHGHGRPFGDRGLGFSSCRGSCFSSSYHDHPCPCPYLCPYRLSQIVDGGYENGRDHGQIDEKVVAAEYACRSAKRRKADSWPTENMIVNRSCIV